MSLPATGPVTPGRSPTPYPVNDPGISEPGGPGSEPDDLPGQPTDPGTRFRGPQGPWMEDRGPSRPSPQGGTGGSAGLVCEPEGRQS
jgi:hypothetical protein